MGSDRNRIHITYDAIDVVVGMSLVKKIEKQDLRNLGQIHTVSKHYEVTSTEPGISRGAFAHPIQPKDVPLGWSGDSHHIFICLI